MFSLKSVSTQDFLGSNLFEYLKVINFSGKVRPSNSLVKSFYEELEK